ncbi:hypothetical protein BT67DRAFT_76748 [Trichocladium antarcticum]|uniref:Uncharacterized protein n=1 Tax=Trichocladium antarcticum TaxID=1450529 RepID=A0AAN6UJA5_9PEZI|nr:hypothetical protein BT67DRAFT_76748 [Trichocladium antarcticum]
MCAGLQKAAVASQPMLLVPSAGRRQRRPSQGRRHRHSFVRSFARRLLLRILARCGVLVVSQRTTDHQDNRGWFVDTKVNDHQRKVLHRSPTQCRSVPSTAVLEEVAHPCHRPTAQSSPPSPLRSGINQPIHQLRSFSSIL